jgi:hypothetical protein
LPRLTSWRTKRTREALPSTSRRSFGKPPTTGTGPRVPSAKSSRKPPAPTTSTFATSSALPPGQLSMRGKPSRGLLPTPPSHRPGLKRADRVRAASTPRRVEGVLPGRSSDVKPTTSQTSPQEVRRSSSATPHGFAATHFWRWKLPGSCGRWGLPSAKKRRAPPGQPYQTAATANPRKK